MQTPNNLSRSPRSNRPTLLVLCLAFSFLLHLLIVLTLPLIRQHSPNKILTEKPTIVRLVDKPVLKPAVEQKVEYEIDQQPRQTDTQKPENAKRLAERNQRVDKEQAPRGIDSRDQPALKAAPSAPPAKAVPQQQPVTKQPTTAKNNETKRGSDLKAAKKLEGKLTAETQEKVVPQPAPKQLPTLEQLTRLTQRTLDRLSGADKSSPKRIKQRDDVEQEDEVWLNLEQGLLISFFRRFRNQIEGVWNYPPDAARNGIEGILLLKITVNRKGELLDVDLEKSSGSDLLDYEAIQAIYRSAPFGPLPSHYPHPDLKINAHFRYMISSKYIYGR